MEQDLKEDLLEGGRGVGIDHCADHSTEPTGTAWEAFYNGPYWNIFFLALAYAWTLTTSTLLTTIGPLCARGLGVSKALSAFTIGAFLIGAAVASVPSGHIFRTYGRLAGFRIGVMCQTVGAILGVLALVTNVSAFLFLGCFGIGLGQGMGQFYRFASVELCPPELLKKAVTYVISGGVISAFLGPTTAQWSAPLPPERFLGSFVAIGVIGLVHQLTINAVRFASAPAPAPAPAPASAPSYESVSNSDTIRSWGKIASQPMFGFSCAIATMAHTVMITLMSNVTLAIDESGYGFNTAVLVLELHFFFMFAPGFFTASLLERYGSYRVSLLGSLASALSVVVLAVDGGLVGYVIGMMLNGLGWNLSFSAGTVMLTSCYSETEATEVQGLNDFIIFSVAGSASLLSGLLYGAEGWKVLVYTVGGLVSDALTLHYGVRGTIRG
ncbi:major facilitator superfamily domain-containing protein [Ochromonadaceae sp. CCMP2298]|nr:major facilitator superfamily domain-containing protein [Ochromonadaceae sp. CCMP2298]